MRCNSFYLIFSYLFIFEQYAQSHPFPIGPRFLSSVSKKSKVYYSNLGVSLDCLADGNPKPNVKWFRFNAQEIHRPVLIQSSDLIETFSNGTLFIRPFRIYVKNIHSASYLCRAENAAGSIQTLAIQLKPQIYESYEIDVKTPYGFEYSSVILTCDISPLSASSYINIIGWIEKMNNDDNDDEIRQLQLHPRTKYNLLPNRNLIIHNLTKFDDNRSYACLVRNKIDNEERRSSFKSLRIRERSPLGPELSIINRTQYEAETGDLVELPCGIASISFNSRISWRKEGKELFNVQDRIYNHSLILHVSAEDSGNYLCQVDDESIGQLTSMMSLKVHVPIQCQMKTKQNEIVAKTTFDLSCSTNSFTSNAWQWFHNSIQLTSETNERLTIHNASREHMGMYQCCYQLSPKDFHSCCDQIQIRLINSPPVIVNDYPTTIVSSSFPLDFNCTFYADPIPDVQLFKDGRSLSPMNSERQILPSGDVFLRYSIHLTTLDDTGLYECFANNSFGSISLSTHVNRRDQIPFIQPMKNLFISPLEEFQLICYGSGQPNLRLDWIETSNDRILNTSNSSPIIWTSKETKSKVFQCRATNSFGEVSSNVSVTMRNPVRIISITTNRTMKIHQRLNVHCAARGDSPLEITLITPNEKRRTTIENSFNDEKNLTMIIDDLDMMDHGVYQCFVRNNHSEHRTKFQIHVENIPDRIENLFVENLKKIYWIKPFDGHTPILHYVLRIRFYQNQIWSNETIIWINNSDTTSYLFDRIMSRCTVSLRIQAVNSVGISLPSDAIQFETRAQELRHAPSNVSIESLSSNSVTLTWDYPSIQICSNETLDFLIEIFDPSNRTRIQVEKYPTRQTTIRNLKTFSVYTFIISAQNSLGTSRKSKALTIRTFESVPLLIVNDLTSTLLNASTLFVSWTIDKSQYHLLNGRFRTFSLSIYENYNMSTLFTIETNQTELNIFHLHSSSRYFISVAVCNFLTCGPSSSSLVIETPSIVSDSAMIVIHPVNKPFHSNCQDEYRCGSKNIQMRFYDKPSTIGVHLHYTTSNEIGLRFVYPPEIIESLTINYKIVDRTLMNELIISPPIFNYRLTNLSCGTNYKIMAYASNEAGFSSTTSLNIRTDGSIPKFDENDELIEIITNESIVLNMNKIQLDQCQIVSFEITIWSLMNSTIEHLDRYLNLNGQTNHVEINHLESNQSYRIHLKIRSDPGENEKILHFRTTTTYEVYLSNDESIFLLIIIISSFVLTIIFCFLSVLFLKFLQKLWKQTEMTLTRPKRFQPILYSAKLPHHNQHDSMMNNYAEHVRSNSFASEDSQGNINPYAVTDFTIQQNEIILCNPTSNDDRKSSSIDSARHSSFNHLHSKTTEQCDSYQSSFV